MAPSKTISCTPQQWYTDTRNFNVCLLNDEGSVGKCWSDNHNPCAASNYLFTGKNTVCPAYNLDHKLSYDKLCSAQKNSLPDSSCTVRAFQDGNILAKENGNVDSLLVASCANGKTYVTAPTMEDDQYACKWTPIEGIVSPSDPSRPDTPNGFFGREACTIETPPNPSGTSWLETNKNYVVGGGTAVVVALAAIGVIRKCNGRNSASAERNSASAERNSASAEQHYFKKHAIHATFLNHLETYGTKTDPASLFARLAMRFPVEVDNVLAVLPDGELKDEVTRLNEKREQFIDKIVSDCKAERKIISTNTEELRKGCTGLDEPDEERAIRKALESTPMLYLRSVFHGNNVEAQGILNRTFKQRLTRFPSYPIQIESRHAGHLMLASVLCGLPGGCPPEVARRISASHRENESWQDFWGKEKATMGINAFSDGSDTPGNMLERALTQLQLADEMFPPLTRFQPNPLNPAGEDDEPWYIQSRDCLVRPINRDIMSIAARHMNPEKQFYSVTGETFNVSGIHGRRAKLGDLALMTMQHMGGEPLPLTVNSEPWPDLALSDEPGVYTSQLPRSPFEATSISPDSDPSTSARMYIEHVTDLRSVGSK